MRQDMGKCVIERPRRGSSEPSAKVRHFGKMVMTEDGPDYEGFNKIPCSFKAYRVLYSDSKDFTDVLGPLEGYLRSSCGRPWDDVYSEIKKTLGRSGWAVAHIVKDHINVAVNTWRGESGAVWNDGKGGPEKVESSYRNEFYVEPETGILRETFSGGWRRIRRQESRSLEAFAVPGWDECRLIKGVWYFQNFSEVEERRQSGVSQWSGKPTFEMVTIKTVLLKRQLSKRELRDLKLKAGAKALPR